MSRSFIGLSWGMPFLLGGSLLGCGPIQSTAFLADSEVMLEAARTAQADKLAPYEWTAANLYYVKATEEVGYADFEQAIDFAKKALDFSTRAKEAALKANRGRDTDDASESGGAR